MPLCRGIMFSTVDKFYQCVNCLNLCVKNGDFYNKYYYICHNY